MSTPSLILKGTSTDSAFDERAGAWGLEYTTDGTLWTIGVNNVGSTAQNDLYYSKDNGATWIKSTALPSSMQNAFSTTFVPYRFFIDKYDRIHVVMPGQGNGWYASGVPNGSYTAYVWQVNMQAPYTDSILSRYGNDLYVIAFPRPIDPAQTDVFLVWSEGASSGGPVQGKIYKGTLRSDGTWAVPLFSWATAGFTRSTSGYSQLGFGVTFRHTGDGKTPSANPDIMVVGPRDSGDIETFLFPYLDTTQASRTTSLVTFSGNAPYKYNSPSVMWDVSAPGGGKWYFVGRRASPTGGQLYLGYINADGSVSGQLADPPQAGAPGYDSSAPNTLLSYKVSGEKLLFVGEDIGTNSTKRWKYSIYNRDANSWSAYTVLDDGYYWVSSAGATNSTGTVGFAYTSKTSVESTPTNQQEVFFQSTNTPPDAPVLTAPAAGATINRLVTQRFSWSFSDPDSGDTQSAYSLRYRLVGSGTWTEVAWQTSSNLYHDFAPSTFDVGTFEWQVCVKDTQGVSGAYSPLRQFITTNSAPNAPIISGSQPQSMLRFNWQFSDADSSDTQTRSEGEVRVQGDSTVVYSWDVNNNLQYHDVAASTFPPAIYEWRVRTYDTFGAAGTWSTYINFTVTNTSNVSVFFNGSWVSSSGTKVT